MLREHPLKSKTHAAALVAVAIGVGVAAMAASDHFAAQRRAKPDLATAYWCGYFAAQFDVWAPLHPRDALDKRRPVGAACAPIERQALRSAHLMDHTP